MPLSRYEKPSRVGALLTCAALSAGALVACGGGSTSSGGSTVKIAVEGPLTGDQASTGQDMYRGAQLAASELNAKGKIAGKKIELIPVDDKADGATGVTVANEVLKKHIAAVVGPYNSSVGIKNLSIYKSAGIAIVRLTSSNLTEGFGVTTQPMASQVAPVEAQELAAVRHVKSVAVLYDPSTYTAGIATQLRQLLVRDGVRVPVFTAVDTAKDPSSALAAVTPAKPAV